MKLWQVFPVQQHVLSSAVMFHILLGAIVLFDDDIMNSTPLSLLADTVGRHAVTLSLMLISASVAAQLSLLKLKQLDGLVSVFLLLPLMVVMAIMATGSIKAVVQGRFLDGVERPWGFILGSELPYIIGCIFYFLGLNEEYRKTLIRMSGN